MANKLLTERIMEHTWVADDMLANQEFLSSVSRVAEKIGSSLREGGKVVVFGNGGSAADAQHMAAELVGRYMKERDAIPAIALTANTSILTALGNDYGFEHVFSRQIEALVNVDDVVIGISTSGNSSNIIYGLEAAKKRGAVTVALVGGGSCRADGSADIVIKVPSTCTPRVQEMHILIIHMICEVVESERV